MPMTRTCLPGKSDSVNGFPSRTSVKAYERNRGRVALGDAAAVVAPGAVLPAEGDGAFVVAPVSVLPAAGGNFAGEGAVLPSLRALVPRQHL